MRQAGDQILGHSVREIVLFAIVAEVGKGQDGDRGPTRRIRSRSALSRWRARFPDVADETKSAPRDRLNELLPFAVVADGLLCSIDPGAQCGIRNDALAPYGCEKRLLTYLRRDRDFRPGAGSNRTLAARRAQRPARRNSRRSTSMTQSPNSKRIASTRMDTEQQAQTGNLLDGKAWTGLIISTQPGLAHCSLRAVDRGTAGHEAGRGWSVSLIVVRGGN